MAIEVMAWNVQDALCDGMRAYSVFSAVDERRPDIAVFPEAYREGYDDLIHFVKGDFERWGYTVVHGLYGDPDGRRDRHGLMGIIRTSQVDPDNPPQLVRLGTRAAVRLPIVDKGTETTVDFFGVHLDDRSEHGRLQQADALLETPPGYRAVVAGDFNAMHRSDPRARVLRVARPLAERLPAIDPDPDVKPPVLRRIGSLASRLTGMAAGTTMARFTQAGFVDADKRREPTKGFVPLDHIMARGLIAARYTAHPHDADVSDHRAISASLQVVVH